MKVGDLVRLPSRDGINGIVGVIADVTTRKSEGLVGVSWPNVESIVYERAVMLEVLG